jgi:hypothetical protein
MSRRRIVISQPMFLPWRGMFEQIRLSDVFVFYDDVQLPEGGGKGRSFMTRVQIKTPKGQEWLSAPVTRSGRALQLIQDTEFAPLDWRERHLAKLQAVYKPAPYFREIWNDVVTPIYAFETNNLSEFCIHSMRLIAARLGLQPEWHISSELGIGTSGFESSERVLEICRAFDADDYITGHGAANYMDHSIFDVAGVRVAYMEYRLTPYPQLYGEFVPYVSILDLLFNVGDAAPAHLNSEAVPWTEAPLAEMRARRAGQRA